MSDSNVERVVCDRRDLPSGLLAPGMLLHCSSSSEYIFVLDVYRFTTTSVTSRSYETFGIRCIRYGVNVKHIQTGTGPANRHSWTRYGWTVVA